MKTLNTFSLPHCENPEQHRRGRSNPVFCIMLLLLLLPSLAHAANTQIAVPKYFNITAYILDDAGHILSNKTQEADFTFRVKDAAGKVQYTEKQHLQVVDGAISAFVGQGSEAGLPAEALNPDGDHILEIQMEGQTVPQERLLLASVPYAFYADKLSGGVKSEDIEDGTIAKDDLSSELMDYINNSVAGISEQEMTDHRTQFGEHSAKQIFVENHFVNTAGEDLQTVLQGLDNAILVHNDKITNDRTSLTQHISASNTNAHSFSNISGQVTGAQIAPGSITITNLDVTTSLGAWDQNASDDVTTTTQFAGDVSGTASNIKIKSGSVGTTELADNAITGAKVQDGTLSLSDFSTTTFDKWDTDSTDDVTTSTQFGGDLSGTASNLQIATGSIVTSDLASQNISQWTNDSQYITDGNTNWDNSYGFITSTDLAGYNFLTTSDLNGYLTSSSASNTYLKQSGGTITGNLTVGDGSGVDTLTVKGNISTTGTVDGVDVKALSTKVDTLASKQSSTAGATAFAYGSCSYTVNPTKKGTVSNSYNASSCDISGYSIKVSLTADASSSSYVVMLTHTTSDTNTLYVCEKNPSYFLVCGTDNNGPPDPFDFIVFAP